MKLDMIETSFKTWDVQLILCCNIDTIVTYLQLGNDREYNEYITTENICLYTVYKGGWIAQLVCHPPLNLAPGFESRMELDVRGRDYQLINVILHQLVSRTDLA